ncbi:MAG: rod shape determining protein RodA [Myxococcota bacterium]|jgi:rod shape determining protein RodA
MKRRNPAFRDRLNIFAALAVVALVTVSLLAQSNAQHYAGGEYYDRQTIWIVIGGAAFVAAFVIDLRLVERAAYFYYGFCILLLLVTLVVGGTNDTSKFDFRRWIHLGPINIQASEFTKLAVILALARFLHQKKERLPGETEPLVGRYSMQQLVQPAMVILFPLALILLQPDLGTALMLIFVGSTMLIMEGVARRAMIIAALATLIAVPVAWQSGLIQTYQKDRIYKLVDKNWEKVDDNGKVQERLRTQVEQAVWAIGTGGFVGQGNRQADKIRMDALPELHSDFILPMVAEERGFVGMTVLLFLFWSLVMWSLRTANDSRTRFCRQIAIGIAALLGWQVFINVSMVTEMLPVVGLPLPFLSYGGSAMLMLMMALGLLFNVAASRGRL